MVVPEGEETRDGETQRGLEPKQGSSLSPLPAASIVGADEKMLRWLAVVAAALSPSPAQAQYLLQRITLWEH